MIDIGRAPVLLENRGPVHDGDGLAPVLDLPTPPALPPRSPARARGPLTPAASTTVADATATAFARSTLPGGFGNWLISDNPKRSIRPVRATANGAFPRPLPRPDRRQARADFVGAGSQRRLNGCQTWHRTRPHPTATTTIRVLSEPPAPHTKLPSSIILICHPSGFGAVTTLSPPDQTPGFREPDAETYEESTRMKVYVYKVSASGERTLIRVAGRWTRKAYDPRRSSIVVAASS
jgi:hypothetical protein